MRLEDEITIYQFAQGLRPVDELLHRFAQLAEDDQQLFFELYLLVNKLVPTDSGIKQAYADSGLDAPEGNLGPQWFKQKVRGLFTAPYIPNDDSTKAYTLLLNLFKAGYQQRYEQQKGSTHNWRYWDLSRPAIAQEIVAKQQALADEVYNSPDFRSEFAAIARLHYTDKAARAQSPVPSDAVQPSPEFVSYDELVTAYIKTMPVPTKYALAMHTLSQALHKALSLKYGLDDDQTDELIRDVVGRHMRETYNWG